MASMKYLVSICLISLFHAGDCFCSNHKVHVRLTEAVVKLSNWFREYHHKNSTPLEPHMTSSMMVSLRLAGHQPKTLLSDFKTGNFTVMDALKAYLDKNEPSKIPPGRLAYITLGTLALCLDVEKSFGHNMTKVLIDGLGTFKSNFNPKFNNHFQYSVVVLALCHSKGKLPGSLAKEIILKLKEGHQSFHSQMPDTTAMVITALSCLRRNAVLEKVKQKELDETISKYLGDFMNVSQSKKHTSWNIHSKSLVVQALKALPSHLKPKPKHLHCNKLINDILEEQDETGSFGNVLANIQVLQALAGRSLVDLGDLSCPKGSTEKLEKKNITVCVKLDFQQGLGNYAIPHEMNLTVPEKITAFEILKLAAEKNNAFKYEALKTSYGRMITAISGVKQEPQNGIYWALYASAGNLAPDGVDIFTPKNNTCIIFRLEKYGVSEAQESAGSLDV